MQRLNGWAWFPSGLRFHLASMLLVAALAGGCAEFRGIPTHGGGKRFNEEELIVSGAIRRALADMDLKELRGRNTTVQMDSISHSGGGYVTFPGIQNFNAGAGYSENSGLTRYLIYPPAGSYLPFSDSRNNGDNTNYNAGVNGSFVTSYNATTLGSDPDLSYLKSALTMKAQHCGVNIATSNADSVLYLLVDVLGTNRSRDDSLLFWSDRLLATCELTYYAQDAKTGQLLFRARHASAAGTYCEHSALGFSAYKVDRTIETVPGTALPVSGDEMSSCSGRTALAKCDKKAARKRRGGLGLARLWKAGEAGPTSGTTVRELKGSLQKYLETQLANARMQMQVGNLNEAQRLLDAVRAVKADFAGLHEIEAELARRRLEAQAQAQSVPVPPAPVVTPAPPSPPPPAAAAGGPPSS